MLALEGRYETFTVGRNIEWEKVKEIYKLGLDRTTLDLDPASL